MAVIGAVSAEYNLETSSDAWHIDFDATEHISNHREWFSSYKKLHTVENIKIGDGKYSNWIRRYWHFAFNGKEYIWKYLSNVFHISELNFDLFSMQFLTRDYDNILTTKNAHSWRMEILLQWEKEKVSYS